MAQTAQVLAPSGNTTQYRPVVGLTLAGSSDSRGAAVVQDAGLAASDKLRTLALTSTPVPNPLDTVPRSMIPDGASRFNAKGKIAFFSRNFGLTSVTRSATEIDVKNPQATATIKDDPAHPGMVDVSIQVGGANPGTQAYQGTLQASPGGFTANTTDGKRLTFTQRGGEIDIKAAGFPQVPGNATLILTRA